MNQALYINVDLELKWYIFFLCGFGYFIDLLYANAFGLAAPAMQQELGFPGMPKVFIFNIKFNHRVDGQYGNIFTSFNSGLAAGVGPPTNSLT